MAKPSIYNQGTYTAHSRKQAIQVENENNAATKIYPEDEKSLKSAMDYANYRANSAKGTIEKFKRPSLVGFNTNKKEKHRAEIYLYLLSSKVLNSFEKNIALYTLMNNPCDLQEFVKKHRNADLETIKSFIWDNVLESPRNWLSKDHRLQFKKDIHSFSKLIDQAIAQSMENKNIAEVCQPLLEQLRSLEMKAGIDFSALRLRPELESST